MESDLYFAAVKANREEDLKELLGINKELVKSKDSLGNTG